MRIRKRTWTEEELLTSPVLIEPEDIERLDERFGRSAPIYLELGCGKGRFIGLMAQKYPDINFLGVERAKKVLAMALRKHRISPSPNVRFVNMDAEELLEHLEPESVSAIFVNFCDPWPGRKKWAKRRLTHRRFLGVYQKLLKQGKLCFKTDNRELFDFSVEEIKEAGWILDKITYDLHETPQEIMTEYETKFVAQGMKIYYLEAHPPGKEGQM